MSNKTCANCPVKRNVLAMVKSEKGIVARCGKTFHVEPEEVRAQHRYEAFSVIYDMFPGK